MELDVKRMSPGSERVSREVWCKNNRELNKQMFSFLISRYYI
jgi:hypothetical protein